MDNAPQYRPLYSQVYETIVKQIAADHGGKLRIANRPPEQGGGAEVTLLLPLHSPPQPAGTSA